jgi:glycosyltransferase involved in cell wall biosynthesis
LSNLRRMPAQPTVVSVFDLDPCKFGSMEEYAVFLSHELKRRGWRNVLVFARPMGPAVLTHFDGTGAVLEAFSPGGRLRQYSSLLSILRRHRADILHFHFFEHYSFLPLWAWLTRPRHMIFTDHWRQPLALGMANRFLCKLWDRVVFRLLDVHFLAVSEHVKKTLVGCYGMTAGRINVVLNGVNVSRFAPRSAAEAGQIRNALGMPATRPLVVSVAALIPQKGVGDLLIAAKQVLEEQPSTLFVVVGTGGLFEPLQQQARELGIDRSVQFVGRRSDVERFLAVADVLVVPSVWEEPAGLVVIEAMAAGRPVVATGVGGIPEYMEQGVTGILVEPHAPEQIAKAVIRLLDSPTEAAAMGAAGRLRVEKFFSMERWVGETAVLYQKLLHASE